MKGFTGRWCSARLDSLESFSVTLLAPSRASPLPHWIWVVHKSMWERACPRRGRYRHPQSLAPPHRPQTPTSPATNSVGHLLAFQELAIFRMTRRGSLRRLPGSVQFGVMREITAQWKQSRPSTKKGAGVWCKTTGVQTGDIVASIPIRMVNVRNPPRKIAILFMLLSLMLSLRCTGRFGMKGCRG